MFRRKSRAAVAITGPARIERLEERRLLAATLVSVDATGEGTPGNAASGGTAAFGASPPAVSANGGSVAFVSDASNLAEGDENGHTDVFLRVTGEASGVGAGTTALSLNNAFLGTGNGNSGVVAAGEGGVDISADGRYVVFVSAASDLVAGDTNNLPDVFLHDFDQAKTVLISVNGAGTGPGNGAATGRPVISADGRFVAFTSAASDLVAGVTDGDGAIPDVFVRDVLGNTTKQASRPTTGNGGGASDGAAHSPSISDDGRYVAFLSAATNLSATTGASAGDQVYVRDATADATFLASPSSAGNAFANGTASDVALSADGRSVAYLSTGTNLVAGISDGNDATAGKADVFVRDLDANVTRGVSLNSAGTATGNGGSTQLAISADGGLVAFASTASDLAAGIADANAASDVFVRDVAAGVTTAISLAAAGGVTASGASGADPFGLSMAADGRTVAFTSAAGNLAGSGAASGGVFVRDRQTAQTRLVAANPTSGAARASSVVLSDDGQRVFYASDAPGLVAGDENGATDIFFDGALGDIPTANLTAAVTSNLPASILAGAKTKAVAKVNVANGGLEPLAQSVTVKLVLSLDETFDPADAAVGTVTKVLKLKPGAGKVLKVKLGTLPTATGNYRLLAQVDPDNALPESDEADNTAISETFVAIAPATVDLGVTVSAAPTTLARGRAATVTLAIECAGNVPASGPVAMTVALTPESGAANVPVASVTKRLRLTPGTRKLVKLRFTVPTDLATGTYAFVAAIQPDPSINDAGAGNNAVVSDQTAVVA